MALKNSYLSASITVKESAIGTTASKIPLIDLSITAREASLSIPEGVLRAQTLRILTVPSSAIGAGSERQAGSSVEIGANGTNVSSRDALTVDEVHSEGTLTLEGLT